MNRGITTALLFLILAAITGPAATQDPTPPKETLEKAFQVEKNCSPYAGRDFPDRVYWGDTHLHTGMSMDAGAFGARLLPEDASSRPTRAGWPIAQDS
jgi:hypothetical protein